MRLTKLLLIGACPLALCVMPALAQSTGTEALETVIVTGKRATLSGFSVGETVPKQRSTITSEFLDTQIAGQTVFQSLNFMPGVNFTNNDPYGTSGGNIRVHGQDGNHIALTLDGMPLNDTGNYAIYTNQMLDPEVVDRVTANQTSTDADSPTAAASGGVIAIQSDKPHEDFGMMGSASFGSFSYQRYFMRLDSGKFGPLGTQMFAAYSYQDYDKWRGPGMQRKQQLNVKFYQDFGTAGWASLSFHWNVNRNNNYNSINYLPSTNGVIASLVKNATILPDVGGGYTGNPLNPYNATEGFGWDQDMQSTCTTLTNGSCSYWYKFRINPSDTGNIRFSSLWHLTSALTMTVDSSLQYVLASGGAGNGAYKETDARLIGATGIAVAPPAAGVSAGKAFGCVAQVGCDLNGDGLIKSSDSVTLQSPSLTNTRRWGTNISFLYQFDDNNTLQVAYALDYGLHIQTGQNAFASLNGVYTPFGGFTDHEHRVYTADGEGAGNSGILRYRDRKSKAILNQAALDYEGRYFDGMLRASVGLRLPFLERDLQQNCYQAINSTNPYCSTQPVTTRNADGTVNLLNGGTQKYTDMNQHAVVRYNRTLPNAGLTFAPFGEEHQFFAAYAQQLSAPKTDNLYQVAVDATSGKYSPFYNINPETSTTYTIGYRFVADNFRASLVGWASQIKNRIVSSWFEDTQSNMYHTVKGVNTSGIDFDASYDATSDLTFYGSVSYNHSNILSNIELTQGSYAMTRGKQLIESPDWMVSGRVQYAILKDLKLGFDAKYVGRRFGSEDNNYRIPDYYTVNADMSYRLDSIGMDNSELRFNVTNLLDKHYFGSMSNQAGQTCWTPGVTNSNCNQYPGLYTGSPRTFQGNIVVKF